MRETHFLVLHQVEDVVEADDFADSLENIDAETVKSGTRTVTRRMLNQTQLTERFRSYFCPCESLHMALVEW